MKQVKLFALLTLLLAGVSCGSDNNEDTTPPTPPTTDPTTPTGELRVVTSSTTIQANGTDYCTVTVFCGDTDVTADADFFDMERNAIDHLFPNGRYTADKPGTLTFWVTYGTQNTYKSPTTITAVEATLPDRLTDPQPESTNFTRKCLVLDFTGTGCGYCPYMVDLLETLEADPEYAPMFIVAAAHQFNTEDPMYLSQRIDQALGVTGFPTIITDMRQSYDNYTLLSGLQRNIKTNYDRTAAKAGISAHSVINGNEVVARVSVKAAEDNTFRVGAMLLESGISATQNVYSVQGVKLLHENAYYSTHKNAIRTLDCRVSSTNYTGHDLGKLNKGDVTDYIFTFQLKEEWVRENCHLIFFVTAAEGKNYYVNNAVATKGLAAELPFEYAK